MIKYISIVLVLISCIGNAQKKSPIRVYYENSSEGAIVFVDNSGYCPFTLDLTMDLKNMTSDVGTELMILVPERTTKMKIAEVKIKNRTSSSSFNFKTTSYMGDAINDPSNDFVYRIPYQNGESYVMSQGYNGNFSHEGKNALDFTMPEGTKICAARSGVVVEVSVDSNIGCPNKRCLDYANSIVIYHGDGTFAEYAHLKKKGSKVKVGQDVDEGEVIGLSGNTGFTSGPHLHFEVFHFRKSEKITLPTKFKTRTNQEIYLKEKKFYRPRE